MEISTVSRAVKIGLHACGIWPYLPSTIFQYRYVMIHYYTDSFSNFMVGVSSAMTYSLLLIKLVILWVNYASRRIQFDRRTFSDILQMMAVDWQNCDLIECCLRITMNRARLSHRVSNWLIDLQLGAIVLYSCGILTGNAGDVEKMNVSAREHILKMKLSFVMNTFPVYALVIIFEFCHLSICPAGYLIVNSNIVILAFSKNMILTVDGITLKMLIMKHQRIIAFTQRIETLYTYIALMLFVSDTIIICCIGFIIITSIGTPGGFPVLVRSILYYFVMNLEAFIYCFAGEYLSTKSRMIGDAAYNSLWYDVMPKQSRTVHLVILRSQKHLSITIGKVMDLSLERFTSIMKASASYISILMAMYGAISFMSIGIL
ncbi:Odorant receptor 285 [Nylanderia fulva]|uniref:Odorant receptor n=1 Tax=Nylanderia fulva TaxID=613905 RepID=A0A6G1LP92_9HYME|nr:Odorant receptor 285 [Nylanderia fulva]